ncbi:hypothetical protein [uncultured Endozoicomonas sp.]|uniref:hypothetical protein n=1 Tax=uncultured Endozoicomonas sp. TaxID=432652 RepID=UPI002605196A|nr:hypothetical protein [uncultured Endozoicomonas sp.]
MEINQGFRRDNGGEGGIRILTPPEQYNVNQWVTQVAIYKKCPSWLLKVVFGQFGGHFLDTLKLIFSQHKWMLT